MFISSDSLVKPSTKLDYFPFKFITIVLNGLPAPHSIGCVINLYLMKITRLSTVVLAHIYFF